MSDRGNLSCLQLNIRIFLSRGLSTTSDDAMLLHLQD